MRDGNLRISSVLSLTAISALVLSGCSNGEDEEAETSENQEAAGQDPTTDAEGTEEGIETAEDAELEDSEEEDGGLGSEVEPAGTLMGGPTAGTHHLQRRWEEQFNDDWPEAEVELTELDGGNLDRFIHGEYDFVFYQGTLTPEGYEASQETCGPEGAIQIPVAVERTALLANLPGLEGESVNMDADTLARS